jgi:aryl-alcohol dehydrogenase-like predicted oxidoreductase
MMRQRPFGHTGMSVSPIGLGTVKFGRNTGLKHPTPFALPTDAEASNLLALAADLGITLIDTAPAYGSSEERLGGLLAGQRQRWILATKVGEEFDTATGTSRFDFSPAHVRFSVERSLRRLRTDVLDMVLVHSDGNDVARINDDGVLHTLAALKAEGKIRATGMSTKTVEGGLLALEQADCAMVTYNLESVADLPVIQRAGALGKAILVKKPLASGHVGTDRNEDPVTRSFRHILSQSGVSSVLVGTLNPGHLKANVAACIAASA